MAFYQRVLVLLIIVLVHPKLFGEQQKSALVFQYQVTHSRNIDQISLIFKKDVQLVVNTSSFQESNSKRLGIFINPMNEDLLRIKNKIQTYYKHRSQTISLLDFMKFNNKNIQPSLLSNEIILRINDEEIRRSSSHFDSLMKIIYQIWDKSWKCLECAIYQKEGGSILRTVKHLDQKKEKVFSRKQLECFSKTKRTIECVDQEYGIFEL